ncbi:hypothetical protein GCM10010329_16630 [Streptomyces spiroverticillatus]|nr:hypothetical protein GCM10010329_16630 [Streptomyces spiroverticillatus]
MNSNSSYSRLSRRSAQVVVGLLTAGVLAFGAQGAAQAAENNNDWEVPGARGAVALKVENNDWEVPGARGAVALKVENNDWEAPSAGRGGK